MKYKFTVANDRYSYSETYDSEKEDGEWLNNYTQKQLNKTILERDVSELTGDHVLFGVLWSLTQSGKFSNWIYQNNIRVSWEKL